MSKKEYDIIISLVVVVIVFFLAGVFIVTLVLLNNRNKKRHLEETLRMKNLFAQEALRIELEIKEQTFKIISQEIHDNIGQALSLAKLNLATTDFGEPEKLKSKIEDSRTLVAKAIQDLRDLSKTINADYLHQIGLTSAIESQIELIKRGGYFSVSLAIAKPDIFFDKDTELVIFRIFQESINNIIKHANASKVEINLSAFNQGFRITIRDDGRGFDPEIHVNKRGFGQGIRNMICRAELIGASLTISKGSESGSLVELVVPNDPKQYAK